MSIKRAMEKVRHESRSISTWDRAIADMEELIQRDKTRISDLRRSIKAFRELRDAGEPFPGERAQGAGASA
jgi:predicted RNase H-like nuclease (RuvC/YqgF family)